MAFGEAGDAMEYVSRFDDQSMYKLVRCIECHFRTKLCMPLDSLTGLQQRRTSPFNRPKRRMAGPQRQFRLQTKPLTISDELRAGLSELRPSMSQGSGVYIWRWF